MNAWGLQLRSGALSTTPTTERIATTATKQNESEDNMVKAVVLSGKHMVRTKDGKTRAMPGDTVDVPEAALATFGDKLKRADVHAAEQKASADATAAAEQADAASKAESEAQLAGSGGGSEESGEVKKPSGSSAATSAAGKK